MEEENMDIERNKIIPTTFLTQNMKTAAAATTTATQGFQKSLHVLRRSRRRCMKEVVVVKEVDEEKEEEDDEEEVENGENEREEIEKKINALQRIVPNGESFGVDKLFDETAGYIVALQYQVKALKALTGFFQKLEKEKTKLGG